MQFPIVSNAPLALIPNLGPVEIGLILIVAVLLFGRRLPDVGRNVGKAIIEFKRGVKGITDDIDEEARKPEDSDRSRRVPELDPPKGTAYRSDAFHDVPPAGDVGRPDPDPVPARPADPPHGEGQPRTS